jgi:hypothetical protein
MVWTIENSLSAGQKVETRKNRSEQMAGHIGDISQEINQEMKDIYGVENFLNADGSINMESYAKRNAFSEGELIADERKIEDKEREWSGVLNENRKAYYLEKFGANTAEEMVAAFKKERAGSKNKKMEMVAMSVLYKVLKDEFIVVHSSVYDDYFKGIDTILVNKKTGDVICAFDEVHDYHGNPRFDIKLGRVKNIAQLSGKRIKYGFTVKNNKIVEGEMSRLPVFLLSLGSKEIDDAFSGISLDVKGDPNEVELRIMEKFIENLYNQLRIIKNSKPSFLIKDNLAKFEQSLRRMEEIVAKYYNNHAKIT